MLPSRHVAVLVDLGVVRANAERVRRSAGVPLIAVVKADAYGLGASAIAGVLADLVDGFYVFDLAEAVDGRLAATGRRTIALRVDPADVDECLAHRVQPAVWDAAAASALRRARPVLSVDTGQQRFGVPSTDAEAIERMLRAGEIDEAFTHAVRVEQAVELRRAVGVRVGRLHAAGSGLVAEPAARLEAVRPGLALYRGAARVSAKLVEVHDSTGPAGYTGFRAPRHGVVLAGYSHGMAVGGPCVVNGRHSRVLEVGMQSAFVECGPGDKVGDEVVLLGDGVTEDDLAAAWRVTPHEALSRMARLGERRHAGA